MSRLQTGQVANGAAVLAVALAALLSGPRLGAASAVIAATAVGLGLVVRSFPLIAVGQAVVVATAVAAGLIGHGAGFAALLAAGLLGFVAGELARVSINLRRRPDPARLGRGVLRPIVRDDLLVALLSVGAAIVATVVAGGSGVAGWFLPLGLLALASFVVLIRFVVPPPPPRR